MDIPTCRQVREHTLSITQWLYTTNFWKTGILYRYYLPTNVCIQYKVCLEHTKEVDVCLLAMTSFRSHSSLIEIIGLRSYHLKKKRETVYLLNLSSELGG